MKKPQRDNTAYVRQARRREQLKFDGLKPTQVWLSEGQMAALKRAYPGPRGGIDWQSVIQKSV